MNLDFRDAIFNSLRTIMLQDSNVICLTNDMGAMGLDQIRKERAKQVVNVGIAEQNLMSVAGGLALAGKRVFAYGIASHITTRCYEQIKLDICATAQPVTIIAIGSGLSYGSDGPTHHAVNDLGYMGALPGLSIFNPSDVVSAGAAVQRAYTEAVPAYIRIDKDSFPIIYKENEPGLFSEGLSVLKPGENITLLSTGVLVHRALTVAHLLEKEGLSVSVVDCHRLRPFNEDLVEKIVRNSKIVVTLEEHCRFGGLATLVSQIIAERQIQVKFHPIALNDKFFLGSASRTWVHAEHGMTEEAIKNTIKQLHFKGSAK